MNKRCAEDSGISSKRRCDFPKGAAPAGYTRVAKFAKFFADARPPHDVTHYYYSSGLLICLSAATIIALRTVLINVIANMTLML